MDLKTGKLSLKYASAFFDLYGEKITEKDFWHIKKLISFLSKSNRILTYFMIYGIDRSQLNHIFIKHFNLISEFELLLNLLHKHQRIELLGEVLQKILDKYLKKNRVLFFNLSSYPSLSPKQIDQAINYLHKNTGQEIWHESDTDQSLIAGLKMQSSGLLYDNTIQSRLKKIHRKLIRQN
jgi:F-type H+-transporting ATPase subunit delta